MIFMPLIDEPENLLDVDLILALRTNFTTRNGLILDSHGNPWYRWRSDGLDAWWRMFEETINAPMGRRLANSACDEEECLLNSGELDFTGLFRKKKSVKSLMKRWWLCGWGQPSIQPAGIDGVSLTPIFAGFLQAAVERIDSKRYRMRWEQKSSDSCILNLEPSSHPVTTAKISFEPYSPGSKYMLNVESGWRIDGQRFHLLPVGMFSRLEESCSGLVANISEDERSAWPEINDGFLSIAIACKNLFIAGEEIFLASEPEGWIDSCNSLFAPMGLSVPISVDSIDDKGGIELVYEQIPLLSVTVGYLAGAWTRCEGRPVKVSVISQGLNTKITLQTRYEIA